MSPNRTIYDKILGRYPLYYFYDKNVFDIEAQERNFTVSSILCEQGNSLISCLGIRSMCEQYNSFIGGILLE